MDAILAAFWIKSIRFFKNTMQLSVNIKCLFSSSVCVRDGITTFLALHVSVLTALMVSWNYLLECTFLFHLQSVGMHVWSRLLNLRVITVEDDNSNIDHVLQAIIVSKWCDGLLFCNAMIQSAHIFVLHESLSPKTLVHGNVL